MSGQQQQKKGWGSLLAGTLSSLESRLDNILIDDETAQAAAQARAQGKTNTTAAATSSSTTTRLRSNSNKLAPNGSATASRDASRTRVNDRLAEKLARATAQKSSRPSTPAIDEDGRASVDSKRADDATVPVPEIAIQTEEQAESKVDESADKQNEVNGATTDEASIAATAEPATLISSGLPINPARQSTEGSRASVDNGSSRASLEIANGVHTPSGRTDDSQSQDQSDIHAYMERIDALQAKLTYLAKETVAAAKKANASTDSSSLEKQLATKDEKIALLMDEGEKLSKNELKHLQTIKKLRSKTEEADKTSADLKKRLERAEKSEMELQAKLKRAEAAERQANDKMKQIATIDKQVEELRTDRENAAELIRNLTTQLKEANERANRAEKNAANKASEADKGTIAHLQNELEDAQIEKKLAEDRAASELRKIREEAERQKEKIGVRELEFKSEISNLESRLEAMRVRAEEASATPGAGDGESNIKLIRQVETLQQQYALAKGNWETIEGSLNARVAALEREKDEATKREVEARKKAREAGAKSRKAEEELEAATDRVKSLVQELEVQQQRLSMLQQKLDQAETSQSDAKADTERQRKQLEAEFANRLEEERHRLRRELQTSPHLGSLQSPTTSSSRKAPFAEIPNIRGKGLQRLTSHDLSALHTDHQRPTSAHRRPSALPSSTTTSARGGLGTPTDASPSISRRESMLSLQPGDIPPTPSIEIPDRLSEGGSSSPQRTIADLVSNSTAGPGAGPSVQLVERMSSLVRKLESEKASFKDELSRLQQQRDSARDEVVELMREVESKRSSEMKMTEMSSELDRLKKRYEASLEMLGEREEEVEELRADVVELKRIYKELVETKVAR
ncbi:hypothetical protein CKM354_000395600 [Cercospora kikuchii]|uniref:TATA element modulatory factor 1 TATA binding domain-containing protein n=1 Tax=Cercospora kikuchii TaxID=84275 RepID=A0A9P3CFX5_9PEZI|nr:uncharacterized protein CKM354_000395600 [Cercospora kikuchii]GIZ40627.1 hypothetical protein CKM354_000395600 [Cercospora kikuchii]